MNITVLPRGAQTKGERRRRLRHGYVPGSLYGRGVEPSLIEVPARVITEVLLAETGMNTVLNVTIQGATGQRSAVIGNLERDPITRGFINVGLHQVTQGDRVHAQIPVTLVGIPTDVALNGALLEQTLEHVEVSAEPNNLPLHLDVDVSGLKIGDVVRVRDLARDPKVTITTPEDAAVAAVHVSTTARQVEEAEATAPVAPETPSGTGAVTELRSDSDPASDSVTGAAGQP